MREFNRTLEAARAALAAGDRATAVAMLEDALGASAGVAWAWRVAGEACVEAGCLADGARWLERALELEPGVLEAELALGRAYLGLGHRDRAIRAFQRAHHAAPDRPEPLQRFTEALRPMRPTRYLESLEPELLECFESPTVHYNDLTFFVADHLVHKHGFATGPVDSPATVVEIIATDRLFTRYLERAINPSHLLERLLAGARGWLLRGGPGRAAPGTAAFRVACAIAHQSFNNEYLVGELPAESALVDALEQRLAATAPGGGVEPALALYSMYRPPSGLDRVEALARADRGGWQPESRRLAQRLIDEPLEERAIAPTIRTFGAIEGEITRAVRSQYEENPYPRWTSIPRREVKTLGAQLREEFPHFRPEAFLDGEVRILVAGGGTGQHPAQVAAHTRGSRVLAVDLSRRSLAHAIRVTRSLGIDNIEFMQADIANLVHIDEVFDAVECVGVLMLLADPPGALRILADRLRPGGVLKLGLYSTIARELVRYGRSRIAELGLTPTPGDIRAYRGRIIRGEEGREIQAFMGSRELFSLSNVRDLLFAPREHAYTLPEVDALVTGAGLEFIGFTFPERAVLSDYRDTFPDDPHMTSLANWDRFEREHPQTFRGMYNFWCHKPAG